MNKKMEITSKNYFEVYPKLNLSKTPQPIKDFVAEAHDLAKDAKSNPGESDKFVEDELLAYYRNLNRWIEDGRIAVDKAKAAPKAKAKPKVKAAPKAKAKPKVKAAPKAKTKAKPKVNAKPKAKDSVISEKIKASIASTNELKAIVVFNSRFKSKIAKELSDYLKKHNINIGLSGIDLKDKLKASEYKRKFYANLLKQDKADFKAIAQRVGLLYKTFKVSNKK